MSGIVSTEMTEGSLPSNAKKRSVMPGGWFDKVTKRFGDEGVAIKTDFADDDISTFLKHAPELDKQVRLNNGGATGSKAGDILKKSKKVGMSGGKLVEK